MGLPPLPDDPFDEWVRRYWRHCAAMLVGLGVLSPFAVVYALAALDGAAELRALSRMLLIGTAVAALTTWGSMRGLRRIRPMPKWLPENAKTTLAAIALTTVIMVLGLVLFVIAGALLQHPSR